MNSAIQAQLTRTISRSKEIYDEAVNYLPGGNTRTTVYMKPHPIYASHGEGCRVWDVDGNAYIDCINNFTSNIHGYNTPVINAAINQQLTKGTCFGMPTYSEVNLAKLIVERVKSIDEIRFTNSGTEAVMMALKAARAYTKKPKIAKVEGAYHGSYDYAEVSLDSNPKNWGKDEPISTAYAAGTPQAVLDDVVVLPFNDLEKTEEILRKNADQLAGVLIDPVPNRAGLIPASQAFIDLLRKLTKELGILLIFDEVISFRLGYHGAQSIWGVEADLTALGKIIGGGFPIGAVGGKKDVMAVFDPTKGKPALPHGGTFSANPISMIAGYEALQLLDEKAFDYLDQIGEKLRNSINKSFEKYNFSGVCVGLGSLLKIHFTDNEIKNYRSIYPDEKQNKILEFFHKQMLNRGILTASYGLIALSTTMSLDDIEEISTAIELTIEEISKIF
ncbi:aspartate aminotransferase family protein [Acinetobacter pseudolwoffii]|uniref:aspartate aminotransferase family protein n=1 Tax=Acinetobacter pseudolwoffii TaxID=2053287 RepID=UPI002469AE8D|nr:aspartate aminotransferase family protein [Acinetobacter pseudolwoffii]MDH5821156.1 aspartate aminotransferase family protein [Acinetobacter pseudolwoffii]